MVVGIRIFWGGPDKMKTKTKKTEIDTIDPAEARRTWFDQTLSGNDFRSR